MKYPYLPKSNSKVEVGEYFPFKINNGQIVYGVIAGKPKPSNRVMIKIGILNLIGNSNIIKGEPSEYVYQTSIHVNVINDLGSQIYGIIKPPQLSYELNCQGGDHCYVIKGYENIRKATSEDKLKYGVASVAGYIFLRDKISKMMGS